MINDGDRLRPTLCISWQIEDTGCLPPTYLHRLAVGRRPNGTTAYHCVSFGGIMINEHDCVVLTSDLPSEGLLSGDVGAVATVLPSQCRPIGHGDINHVPLRQR
jgi:hypothetical protein